MPVLLSMGRRRDPQLVEAGVWLISKLRLVHGRGGN